MLSFSIISRYLRHSKKHDILKHNIILLRWNISNVIVHKIFHSEAMGSTPKFLGELQNVTVSMGREATFTCTVTRLGGHRVSK